MESNTKEVVQARVRPKIKTKFEELFNESNFDTKGEFINHLLDKSQEPEKIVEKPIVKVEEVTKIVEIPAKLKDNQVLVNLTPIQKYIMDVAVDMKAPADYNPDDPDPDGTGDGSELELTQGDIVFREQNYYALSPSYKEKYGDLYSPLVAHEPDKNKGRILINLLMAAVYNRLDGVPGFSRRQLREIADKIKEKEEKEKQFTEYIKNMPSDEKLSILKSISKDEIKSLFGDLENIEEIAESLSDTKEEKEEKTEIEETIE